MQCKHCLHGHQRLISILLQINTIIETEVEFGNCVENKFAQIEVDNKIIMDEYRVKIKTQL